MLNYGAYISLRLEAYMQLPAHATLQTGKSACLNVLGLKGISSAALSWR